MVESLFSIVGVARLMPPHGSQSLGAPLELLYEECELKFYDLIDTTSGDSMGRIDTRFHGVTVTGEVIPQEEMVRFHKKIMTTEKITKCKYICQT